MSVNLSALKYHVPAMVAFIVVFMLVLKPMLNSLLPPVDTPHYAALSAAFYGQSVEGPLKYPPVVPFLFLLIRGAASDVPEAVFLGIKMFGAVLLVSFAVGAYIFLWKLGRNWLAALVGSVFSASTVVYLETVAWGGYPQLLGLCLFWFAAGATVDYCRHQQKRQGLIAAVMLGLVVATHSVTAIFTFVTVATLMLVSAIRQHRVVRMLRDAAWMCAVAVLISAAALPTYLATFKDSVGVTLLVFNLQEMMRVFSDPTVVVWTVVALIQVPILLILAKFGKDGLDFAAGAALGAIVLAALSTMMILPSLYPFRSQHFLLIPVTVAVGVNTWYWARLKKPRWIKSAAVLILLLPYSYYSFDWYQDAVPYYSRASASDVEGYKFLDRAEPQGGVIVASPIFPNTHGWWIESIASRRVFVEDDMIWYILNAEREAITIARTVAHSVSYVDGGAIQVFDNAPLTGLGSPSLFVRTPNHFFDVLGFDDDSSFLEVRNESDGGVLRSTISRMLQGHLELIVRTAGSISVLRESVGDTFNLSKRVEVVANSTELEVGYSIGTQPQANLTFCIYVPTETIAAQQWEAESGTIGFDLRFRRTADRALREAEFSVILTVESQGFNFADYDVLSMNELGFSYLNLRFEAMTDWHNPQGAINFRLAVEGYGFENVEYRRSNSLLLDAGIAFVFLASGYSNSAVVSRFELDREFERVYEREGTVIFCFTRTNMCT